MLRFERAPVEPRIDERKLGPLRRRERRIGKRRGKQRRGENAIDFYLPLVAGFFSGQ
jgi:hypothetical protein